MFVRRWRLAMGLLAMASIMAIATFVWRIESSSRPTMAPERIAAESPEVVPRLRERGLKTEYQVDGIDFAGKHVGTRMPGELVIDWRADGGLSFHQEVWQMKGPMRAWWRFRSENPRSRFERDGNSALVADVDPSNDLHADSYMFFCGNVGHSKTPELEDCQLWGYWARYGQYLVYLELAGDREPKSAMDEIVEFFDARIAGQ